MQSMLIQILGQTTGQRANGAALLPAIGNEQLPPDTGNAKVFGDVFIELSSSAPMIQVPNVTETEPTLATDAEPVPSTDDAAAAEREAELLLKIEKTPLELPRSDRPEVHLVVGVQTADQVEHAKEMHPLQPSDIVQKPYVMHRSDVSFSPLANAPKEPTFLSTTDAAEPDPDIVLSNSPIKGDAVGLNDTTPSLHYSADPERTPMSNQKADATPQPIQAIRSSTFSDAAKAEFTLNAPAKAALGVFTNFGQASVKTATMLAEPPAQQLTHIPIFYSAHPKDRARRNQDRNHDNWRSFESGGPTTSDRCGTNFKGRTRKPQLRATRNGSGTPDSAFRKRHKHGQANFKRPLIVERKPCGSSQAFACNPSYRTNSAGSARRAACNHGSLDPAG